MPKVAGLRATVHVDIRVDRTAQVAALLTRVIKQTTAFNADALAFAAESLAPVDTGALRASIYVNDGDASTYDTRVGQAERLNPDMEALDEIHPEFVISLQDVTDKAYVVVVGVAAHYGIFQEEGTVFQPPQSFLRPAAESIGSEFQNDMTDAIRQALG